MYYSIYLWAIWEFFDFEHKFDVDMWVLIGRDMGHWAWGVKGQVWVKISAVSFVFWVRGLYMAWIAS